jgi:hypothetical protein
LWNACAAPALQGVRLVSDRQPTRLRVDEHNAGPPAVWLHDDGSTTAWVIVDIGQQAWSQLAYQFGHEGGQLRRTRGFSGRAPLLLQTDPGAHLARDCG